MRGKTVTLVGVGLMGGSIGLALRRRKAAEKVVGFARRSATVEEALAAGAVDQGTTDLSAAVEEADLIVLCVPPGRMGALAERFVPCCRKGALVTDIGSVKRSVVEELAARVRHTAVGFVGSHPMAGGEKSGVAHASAELFEGAICAVTPQQTTPRAQVERICEFWAAIGGKPIEVDPARHDRLVGRSSHLPHIVASVLAYETLEPDRDELLTAMTASGFADVTRIAEGHPEIWQDILLANADNVGEALDGYLENLAEFRRRLAQRDAEGMGRLLREARNRRKRWAETFESIRDAGTARD